MQLVAAHPRHDIVIGVDSLGKGGGELQAIHTLACVPCVSCTVVVQAVLAATQCEVLYMRRESPLVLLSAEELLAEIAAALAPAEKLGVAPARAAALWIAGHDRSLFSPHVSGAVTCELFFLSFPI